MKLFVLLWDNIYQPKSLIIMKNLLPILLLGFTTLFLAACKHSAKDPDVITAATPKPVNNDDISKETIVDRHGDEMEVITNTTKKRIIVRLNGKTYELKKNLENPGFSTEDNAYQFTETKYEVTLLKKDADMVLFHGKRDQSSAKLASQ